MNTEETTVAGFSIVISAFNEEAAISSGIRQIREVLDPSGYDYEIIVVDDGSQDKTAELARAEGVHLVELPENQGYGAAL